MGWVLARQRDDHGAAAGRALRPGAAAPAEPGADTPRLADYKKLPRVSILVPLLREEAVAERLLEALAAMDYPAALLDIKLVLEADDEITRAAIDRAALPPTIEVVTVPADAPADQAAGDELRPALLPRRHRRGLRRRGPAGPGQIRAVVRHLQSAPPEVACVQGYLDFYNASRQLARRAASPSNTRSGSGWCCSGCSGWGCRSRSAAPASSSAATCSSGSAPGTRTTSPRTPTSACGWRGSAIAAR